MVNKRSCLGGLLLSLGCFWEASGSVEREAKSSMTEERFSEYERFFKNLKDEELREIIADMRSQALRCLSQEDKLRYISDYCRDKKGSELVALFESIGDYSSQRICGSGNIASIANGILSADADKNHSLALAFLLTSGEEGLRILEKSLINLDPLCLEIHSRFASGKGKQISAVANPVETVLSGDVDRLLMYPAAVNLLDEYRYLFPSSEDIASSCDIEFYSTAAVVDRDKKNVLIKIGSGE